MVSVRDITRVLLLPGAGKSAELKELLSQYVEEHVVLSVVESTSPFGPNLRGVKPPTPCTVERERDDFSPILIGLQDVDVLRDEPLCVNLMKVLRILLRREVNRSSTIAAHAVPRLVAVLGAHSSVDVLVECLNCFTNLFYCSDLVVPAIEQGILPTLRPFLSSEDSRLVLKVMAVLQCISYTKEGRHEICVQEPETVLVLVKHLYATVRLKTESKRELRLKTRVVEVIHNLSSENRALALIREAHGVSPLVLLLRHYRVVICRAAAATLQNLSREHRARQEIINAGSIAPLTELLVGSDITCQAIAAGTLFNLLAADIKSVSAVGKGHRFRQPESLRAFCEMLSSSIALGAIYSSIS